MARPTRSQEAVVVRRARRRCEYCHFPEAASELPFHLDHIVAGKHRGPTAVTNLAWACFSCNLYKGTNIAGIDPVTGRMTRLFNPRRDVWSEHFGWADAWLRGKTAIGRTTIAVLAINSADSIAVREALRDEGLWPP